MTYIYIDIIDIVYMYIWYGYIYIYPIKKSCMTSSNHDPAEAVVEELVRLVSTDRKPYKLETLS